MKDWSNSFRIRGNVEQVIKSADNSLRLMLSTTEITKKLLLLIKIVNFVWVKRSMKSDNKFLCIQVIYFPIMSYFSSNKEQFVLQFLCFLGLARNIIDSLLISFLLPEIFLFCL